MKHGANIYKYAKKLKCHPNQILDFSSNINLYHPNPNIKVTNEMLVRYGDSSYGNLKDSIAQKYQIKKNQISLYNGASSAIYELFTFLNPHRVYLYAPLYGEYEKALPKQSKIIKINRFEKITTKPKKNATVVFVNPSTPDGKYYKLKKLFKLWIKQECTIILDESFLEFEYLKSMRDEINTYKKLYIIQSFSKFYACAGVRIGAIFSHKSNIKKLITPLWYLSSFDTAFLTKRIIDTEFDIHSRNLHKTQKKELRQLLKDSKLFSKIYKSDSNFILVKSKKAKEIFQHLLKHKILVRTCESFDFLDKNYLRFGVKDSFMHKSLKKAFQSFS